MENQKRSTSFYVGGLLTAFLVLTVIQTFPQSPETIKIRSYVKSHEHSIMDEFASFLSIPNVAVDTVNLKRNAAFVMEMMRKRNISNIQFLLAKTKGVPPVIYGDVIVPGAKHSIILYAHYDGQPVNPRDWNGHEPFIPQLFTSTLANHGMPIPFPVSGTPYDPQWRIYGRSTADDKAGIAAILNAYEAVSKNALRLNYNIKFLFEGEEEAGSAHLSEILESYSSLLQSDLLIVCDGSVHQSGKKKISFGVRGDTHLDLTVYGPNRPLHSGHYGNWAPNPGLMLAKLLASMKDDSGMVTIKGFYDDVQPLTEKELKAIHEMPDVDQQMKEELGLAITEMKGKSLTEAIALPSLNINGMQSGNVGILASNVIPTTAVASLDLRLVMGNDWRRQQEKVIDHIRLQGYEVIDHEPADAERKQFPKLIKVIRSDNSYNAQRTPITLPIAKNVIDAVKSTTNEGVVIEPFMGASLPLYLFEKYLKANTISVPIANHDNNQHAENENIRLFNLFTGIETMAAVLMMKSSADNHTNPAR